MSSFYQEYKEKREELGISLEEISDRTKITLHFLQAIEDGNFDILPETYVRLFLRSYAREIKVDPDEAVKNFEAFVGKTIEASPEDEAPAAPEKPKKEEAQPVQPSGPTRISAPVKPNTNWKRSVLLIVLFGFILWAIKSYVGSDARQQPANQPVTVEMPAEPDTVAATGDTTSASISDERVAESELIGETQQAVPSPEEDNPITLEFDAVGRTWVRIVRDTLSPEEYIFLPQDTRTFEATERILLRVGNSAGAQITVNGEEIGRLGDTNTITDLEINRNGIVTQENFAPPEDEETENPQTS
jgi:cytoskeletal protein RodZ